MNDSRLDRICQMVRTLKESPTMSVGAGGYTSSADATGPVADQEVQVDTIVPQQPLLLYESWQGWCVQEPLHVFCAC